MLESALQSKILKFLKAEGAYTIKIIAANRSGVSDIILCHKGVFISIEVKVGYNKPSKLQLYNLKEVKKAGGLSVCVWSMEELKEFWVKSGFGSTKKKGA